MTEEKFLTWVAVSESAYVRNLEFFRRLIPSKTEMSVVIKANAYGHGMAAIARLAANKGVDSFCVHSLDEAVRLRSEGFRQDILIMGPVPGSGLEQVIDQDFRLILYNPETLEELDNLTEAMKRPVRVHLKLETGTHRQGIDEAGLDKLLEKLKNASRVRLEAAYTHFANIEDTTDHSYAFEQKERFIASIDRIKQSGFSGIKRHVACSAAALLFPDTHFEMVRIGIGQYGLWPSRETFVSYKIRHSQNGESVLLPVLTWKTRISQLKTVAANRFVGYGCTFLTTRESRLAVLPVGYSDGYDRRLSNQSHVLIRGQRAPVRGRVCMNFIMADVTDIPDAGLGDEAVLIGRQGKEKVTADHLAALIGTINYEVVTRIDPGIPRVVVP